MFEKSRYLKSFFFYLSSILSSYAGINHDASEDVTFFSYFECRPMLITDDPPNQTEAYIVSRECVEVSGQRASPSHDGMGPIKAARRGGGVLLFYLPTLSFGFQFPRQKLAQPKTPRKLVQFYVTIEFCINWWFLHRYLDTYLSSHTNQPWHPLLCLAQPDQDDEQ